MSKILIVAVKIIAHDVTHGPHDLHSRAEKFQGLVETLEAVNSLTANN